MKKIGRLYLVFFLALLLMPNIVQAQDIKLWINGNYVTTDTPPILENDRTLVPLRVISENMGLKVEWVDEFKQAQIYNPTDDLIYTFEMGKSEYGKGDIPVSMDVAPKIVNNRTFVPIRVISEAFGKKIDWDNNNRTVVVGDGYQAPTAPQTNNTFPSGIVSRVIDGDTLEVNIEGQTYKLRMIGVNTPETKHPRKGVEFFGKEASNYTTEQLTGKTVYLQKDVSETDKYGRLLRYVWLSRPATNEPTKDEIKSLMFNSILVANGYANSSSYAPDVKYQDIFKELEIPAREQGWGLWGYEEPIETPAQTSEKIVLNKDISQEYIADTTQGKIKGNKKSKIYHVPGGASYNRISVKNVVYFNSEADARAAGYRKAKN